MKIKKITLLVFFTIYFTSYGQNYKDLIKKGDSCYNVKEYKISRDLFAKAFKIETKNSHNLYNGACASALANDKKNAFSWLNLSVDNGWTNLEHLKTDSDLESLHSETKWNKLIEKLQKKNNLIEANYDKSLQEELLEIYKNDQEIRIQLVTAQKKYGFQGKEIDSLGKIKKLKDSLNLIAIEKILNEKGWVGIDKVGQQANETLFLVIQHSGLKSQKKYLPMMKKAVKKGNANPGSLALLIDRVEIQEGRKQIYGSQIGTNTQTQTQYVFPLIDPDNVDERRAEVGLGTLADYMKNFNITWNVEQYKKDLPEIEEMSKTKK